MSADFLKVLEVDENVVERIKNKIAELEKEAVEKVYKRKRAAKSLLPIFFKIPF